MTDLRPLLEHIKERGCLTAEVCNQLREANVPVYRYVSKEAVERGEVKELPPELLKYLRERPD